MKHILSFLVLLLFLTGCSEMEFASHLGKKAFPTTKSQGTFKVGTPYKIEGQRYYPKETYDLVETGIASWYGAQFHNKKTANGETFDKNELTAAHRTLQMPSLVRVTNLENGRSLIVRVNDRGPYRRGRIMDVSEKAAELLGFKNNGTAKVKLEVLTQESLQIAQAAKSGQDTSGYEVALNRGGGRFERPAASVQVASATSPSSPAAYQDLAGQPASVTSEVLLMPAVPGEGMSQTIPGHTRNGAFYPDAVVTEMPVTRTDIFVQAGSFTVKDNAYHLSAQLQKLAHNSSVYPAMVNGTQFYRVRLGPAASVEEADELLARVIAGGNASAMIVVE
ncbi:MAG: septal ring lytic transglycosylase RlpA family protein [Alphaproteobacteria bacterium CG_4_9_14_3_um_filter_47_13]|nr:MAG: septal ring lytic transglycosylase RlpA family protein [Alphaproteobacteria bacterium CG_4_9_14_3_um_filter_47_13]